MNLFAAVRVVLIIVSADAEQPKVSERAVRSILAEGVELDVRVRATHPTTNETLADGDTAALGVIEWDPKKPRAKIRLAREGHWMERGLDFTKDDAAYERWRAVGFAFAAMLPPDLIEPRPRGAPPRETPREDADGSARSGDGKAGDARGDGKTTTGGSAQKPNTATEVTPPKVESSQAPLPEAPPVAREEVSRPATYDLRRFSAEAAFVGALGIEGAGSNAGGALAFRYFARSGLGVGGAASVRFGSISEAQSSSQTFVLTGALSYRPWSFESHRLAVGGTLAVGALVQRLSYLPAGAASATVGARTLPVAQAVVDILYRLQPGIAGRIGVGGEVAFGPTDVVVAGERVATLPVFRTFAEVGACVLF